MSATIQQFEEDITPPRKRKSPEISENSDEDDIEIATLSNSITIVVGFPCMGGTVDVYYIKSGEQIVPYIYAGSLYGMIKKDGKIISSPAIFFGQQVGQDTLPELSTRLGKSTTRKYLKLENAINEHLNTVISPLGFFEDLYTRAKNYMKYSLNMSHETINYPLQPVKKFKIKIVRSAPVAPVQPKPVVELEDPAISMFKDMQRKIKEQVRQEKAAELDIIRKKASDVSELSFKLSAGISELNRLMANF
jgi:hypothetical protein